MCGIFGITSTEPFSFPLESYTNTLSHRGPDDWGFHKDDHAGLGHRRLSIIDLAGGKQPIYNEDRSKCIIFNGEIYNFQELHDILVARGHSFTTRSDTETIIHAYEEWGEACIDQLRGMFAFAIWDSANRTLFLARDRLGIKPLFYAQHRGRFYFASEMKAILADPSFPRQIDELALTAYFTYSYIPSPLTIFSSIRKLEPGHTMLWKNGELRKRKYWDIHFVPEPGRGERYYTGTLIELLQEAVRLRMISEVPLGAFLSGGVDSSTVVALMSRASSTPVNTFCIGFGGETGGYLDERVYARQVAERCATDHKEFEVTPQPENLVEKIVQAFDEPFADDSTIPSYFVCKIARENVTVALSGLGGDEIFAGYERYLGFRLRGMFNRLPAIIREKIIRRLVEGLPERQDGHYTVNHMKRFVRFSSQAADRSYLGYLSILKKDLQDSLYADRERFVKYRPLCDDLILSHFNSDNVTGDNDTLNRALYCDLKTYLPEDILAVTDRLSMHHSLEVRVPFIDHKFMEFCATIPVEMKMKWLRKKYLLKKATQQLLPREVITHRKQGFVGPMTQWLKHDLKPYVLETLTAKQLAKHGLLDFATVSRIMEEHFSGKEIHDTLIWSLLIFQKWYDMYIDD